MTGDIPAAAFRLLTALPVRTHLQPPEPERQYRRARKMPKQAGLHAARPVEVGGVRYDSIADLCRHLKIGYKRAQNMVTKGGRFLEADDDLS